jgi:hypothetical protein
LKKCAQLRSYSLHIYSLSANCYLFDADPDPDFFFMRMRFRIRIQVTKMMRIRIHTTGLSTVYDCNNSLPSTSKILATEQLPLDYNGRVRYSIRMFLVLYNRLGAENLDLRSFFYF